MNSRLLPLVTIVALTMAGLFACACDLALTWDGSAQFYCTISAGHPFVYGARFFSAILWWPVVWVGHFSHDLALLRFCYGLPLCLAPALSTALSWWMVRRTRPEIFPWAVLGICVPSALTQIFVINESLFQQNVFWPVFVAMLVPLDWPRRLAVAFLLVFQFSHPQGAILLSGAAACLWFLSREKNPPETDRHRRRALVLTALAALGILRILLTNDPEAAVQANVLMVLILFWQGLVGWPLAGWLCIVAAVGMLATGRSARFAVGLIALGAGAWLWWAADPRLWAKALDGRRFVIILGLPFFYGAWRSLLPSPRGWPASSHLPSSALALALIFFTTHCIQAAAWHRFVARLTDILDADPRGIIPVEELTWIPGTPLEHWSRTSLVIVKLGGRKLVLDAAERSALSSSSQPASIGNNFSVGGKPGPLGHFDFRQALGSE